MGTATMTAPLLEVEGVSKSFGGIRASNDVSLDVAHGEIHALIGPNGAGKSTLVGLLTGELMPDAGAIRFKGRDITGMPVPARSHLGIARCYQITSVCANLSVRENIALAVQSRRGHSYRFIAPATADRAVEERTAAIAAQQGIELRLDTPASDLSYGEQRQLEFAMALATEPELLLLDEPMAGVGSGDAGRMRDLLADLRARYAILLIEHDMDVVASLADRVTVLVNGSPVATGTMDDVRANAEVQAAYFGDEHGEDAEAGT